MNGHYASVEADILLLVYRNYLLRIGEHNVRRNKLVHYLMNSPTEPAELQEVAEQGYELVKQLDNKVKSVNQYFDKKIGDLS